MSVSKSKASRSKGAAFKSSILAILALSAVSSRVFAQCVDPPLPTGGFAIVENIDVPQTWSDGYDVLMDVRYPVDPPGPCGWPLVMVIHGGGGNKAVVASIARQFARIGYLTCAYDVRGQGPSMALNPLNLAHDFTGLRELVDLFEAMEATEAFDPARVDFSRIGVTGYSQGGSHSWLAAQHSGRLPPPNPWRVLPFPVVSAVVVRDSAAGAAGGMGDAFRHEFVEKVFGGGGIVYQPAITALLQGLVLAEDFAGVAAATTVPGLDPFVLLPQTTVPVFAHASYDDKKINPSGVLNAWDLVPSTTEKRLQFGTGGHDSPNNERDDAVFEQTRVRWFDRFLKDDLNGVENEPQVFVAVTPDSVAAYQDASALWDFREQEAVPSPASVTMRGFLGAANTLVNAPPGFTTSALVHNVPGFANIAGYAAVLPTPAQLMATIPLNTLEYDTAPLVQDRLLQGEAVVRLEVVAADPDYQIHAAILDVDPAGARFVASGQVAMLGAAGANTIDIPIRMQSYVFRQGHVLRLAIQNLTIHTPPTGNGAQTEFVPYFSNSTVMVLEGGASPSYVDLPFLPFTAPTLSAYPLVQSVAAPENQFLAVHSNTGAAGAAYALLPSLSGTAPGTLIAGANVPINVDALTFLLLANPGLPLFVNAFGALNANGSAFPGVALAGLPLPPGLVGFELSMAVICAGTPNRATNAVTIPFVP